MSIPKTPSGMKFPSTRIRCTFTEVIKNLLQLSSDSVALSFVIDQEQLPNIEEFFNSIQTNKHLYKASLSHHLSSGLSPDVEETTFKNTTKSWFIKTADFGDSYDQLLQHPDGRFTQLLEDLARYHEIFQQGYDKIVLVRPSIYAGYDIQLTAAMKALGYTSEQFQFIVVEPIKLYAFHVPTQRLTPIPDLSSEELIQAIGVDALRWHSLRVPLTSIAPINISTAGQPTSEDSLYQVQSAHARCCALLHQAHEQEVIQLDTTHKDSWTVSPPLLSLSKYDWDAIHAQELVNQIQAVPQVLSQSAAELAPHLVIHHLEAISQTCYLWLNSIDLTQQNCALLLATKQVFFDLLENTLTIQAPEALGSN